jgi:hypothetical protein
VAPNGIAVKARNAMNASLTQKLKAAAPLKFTHTYMALEIGSMSQKQILLGSLH